MVKEGSRELEVIAEDILQSIGIVSPGFLNNDGILPEENKPYVISEEVGILFLEVVGLGLQRGILFSKGVDRIRELFPEQEDYLREVVSKLVKVDEILDEDEVPGWVFEDLQME